jgi:hypothetical protein
MRNVILNAKTPASLEYLYNFAKTAGIEIPSDLVNFFCENNGGYPKFNRYLAKDKNSAWILHEFLFVGSVDNKGDFEDTIEDLMLEQGVIPVYLIPFAIDEGGDFYCISTEKSNYGKIYFFWMDFCDDINRAIEYVALSLDEFIENME